MSCRAWEKKDNTNMAAKIKIRKENLPKDARVLDLFCGEGEMYKQVYRDKVLSYHGVDKEKIHTPGLCTMTDNIFFITKNNLDEYNVFDLDDYGSPWKQMYLILKKLQRESVTLFITDGLVMKMSLGGDVTKFVSATEKIPRKFNIPGIGRWYIEIFATMLCDIKQRYGWEITFAQHARNQRGTVYYWCVKMRKT